MFEDERYIARIATMRGQFVGMTFGMEDRLDEKELSVYPKSYRFFHLYYMFLEEQFRSRGYGAKMLRDVILRAKLRGYDKLTAYAMHGPSLHNMRKLGAKTLAPKPNYGNSGFDYDLCLINL
jgi:GNAT superfamily N-acetyltransferase